MKTRMRVLVALTASPYDPSDLERAAQLAAALEADLHGLFLEDLELLALAALPGAVEVSYPRATERKLELARLEQSYRREAEKARARLLEYGSKVHVRCDFEVVRERRVPGALSRAREPDVVFVMRGGPLLTRRSVAAQPAPVLVICDVSAPGRRALRAGSRMARRAGVPVVAALVDGMSRAQRARAIEELQTEAPGATFAPVRAEDWIDWAALARSKRASLVLIGLSRSQLAPADVEKLVRQAGCPAVLVG